MQVPGNDETAFRILYAYLRKGTYGPALDDRIETPDPSRNVSPGTLLGPPRIIDYQADSQPFLLPDIKVYRLATLLGFSELQKHSLERLYAQSFTTDDPCEALEEVYHGGPAKPAEDKTPSAVTGSAAAPSMELREWARAWLKVKSSSSYESNLQILQEHPMWKVKYTKLRERGSELITDIDTVEMELANERTEMKKKEEEKEKAKKREQDWKKDLLRAQFAHQRDLPPQMFDRDGNLRLPNLTGPWDLDMWAEAVRSTKQDREGGYEE